MPLAGTGVAVPVGFAEEVAACTACALHATRTTPVVGAGTGTAKVLILGEAPGADEDRTGLPFVGRSGRLLRQLILDELGLEGDALTISNLVRCRPPGNATPTTQQRRACWPFMVEQIAFLQPAVIITVGNTATQQILATTAGITTLRGVTYEAHGAVVIPTYHPAAALRGGAVILEALRSDLRLARPYLGGVAA